MGDWNRAVAYGSSALAVANELDDFSIEVWTRFYTGLAFFSLGNIRGAVEFLGRNAESLSGEVAFDRFGGVSLPAVVSRSWLSWCLAELGEYGQALLRAA